MELGWVRRNVQLFSLFILEYIIIHIFLNVYSVARNNYFHRNHLSFQELFYSNYEYIFMGSIPFIWKKTVKHRQWHLTSRVIDELPYNYIVHILTNIDILFLLRWLIFIFNVLHISFYVFQNLLTIFFYELIDFGSLNCKCVACKHKEQRKRLSPKGSKHNSTRVQLISICLNWSV